MHLKQLKYILPHADSSSTWNRHPLKIDINFEKGQMQITGNYRHAMAMAREGIDTLPEWVQIDAYIYPAEVVDLNPDETGSMIYSVDGQLNDGLGPNPCAGLLVLESSNTTGGWDLTLYLYDQLAASKEVRIRLPVCYTTIKPFFN